MPGKHCQRAEAAPKVNSASRPACRFSMPDFDFSGCLRPSSCETPTAREVPPLRRGQLRVRRILDADNMPPPRTGRIPSRVRNCWHTQSLLAPL